MALRPIRMAKVGLIGLRADEEKVLTVLHDLRVAQVEPLGPETMALLAPERGSETLRRVGDETLRFRGLLSALPRGGPPVPRRFDSLSEILAATETIPIDAEVGDLKREDDRLLTEKKANDDTIDLLGNLAFYPDRLEYLHSASYLTFYGETSAESLSALEAALPPEADARLLRGPAGETVRFLVITRPAGAEALGRIAQSRGVRLAAVPALSRTATEELSDLRTRVGEIVARRREIAARLEAIAREWYPTLAAIDEALEIENRKSEVLAKLGASATAFALEAWVPRRDVERLKSVVTGATDGRTYFYEVPTREEPPTLMNNPAGVRRFEFFVRFYSLPQATEWDPTLVFAIAFPIFFGFMLGDWGYGLVILLVSVWMIRGFPGARYLPKAGRNFVKLIMGPKGMQQLAYALLPGCGLAIAIGLYTDAFFGAPVLAAFGYATPADPLHHVGSLLLLAGYVGLGMVVLGFGFGVLKEYFHHHLRAAFGKVGGILFAFGVAFFGLALIHRQIEIPGNPWVDLYLGLMVGGLVLLVGGEGLQMGMMGLIEVVSHILSYTRLVGILLASVVLALVINTIGSGLAYGGTAVGIVAGLVILVVGQTFNVILGVFEPGIQGARLIFVEYFSKFYSGNGRPFRPFGAPRRHTVSPLVPEAPTVAGPIVQAPEA